jgi:hypothetical protein
MRNEVGVRMSRPADNAERHRVDRRWEVREIKYEGDEKPLAAE